MAKIKRIICFFITLAIVAANCAVFAESAPDKVSSDEVLSRAQELRIKLDEKYFTSDGYPCTRGSNSARSHYSCDNCFNLYITQNEGNWFGHMFGKVDVLNFPVIGTGHGVSYQRAWTCAGFANFAAWYLFKSDNDDKITFSMVAENIPITHENLRTYCKPGDGIRVESWHSLIYLSENSYFDCNAAGLARANLIKFHDKSLADTSYAGKTMTIYRAENYVDAPVEDNIPNLNNEYDLSDEGEADETVVEEDVYVEEQLSEIDIGVQEGLDSLLEERKNASDGSSSRKPMVISK